MDRQIEGQYYTGRNRIIFGRVQPLRLLIFPVAIAVAFLLRGYVQPDDLAMYSIGLFVVGMVLQFIVGGKNDKNN